MPPSLTERDVADRHVCDAELTGQGGIPSWSRGAGPNCQYLLVRESRSARVLAARDSLRPQVRVVLCTTRQVPRMLVGGVPFAGEAPPFLHHVGQVIRVGSQEQMADSGKGAALHKVDADIGVPDARPHVTGVAHEQRAGIIACRQPPGQAVSRTHPPCGTERPVTSAVLTGRPQPAAVRAGYLVPKPYRVERRTGWQHAEPPLHGLSPGRLPPRRGISVPM